MGWGGKEAGWGRVGRVGAGGRWGQGRAGWGRVGQGGQGGARKGLSRLD